MVSKEYAMEHEELSRKQIAERLSCSDVTVWRLITRAGKKPIRHDRNYKGKRTPIYDFNEEEWRTLDDQYKSFARARQMPDIGKAELVNGFINKFGTDEQKALMNAANTNAVLAVARIGKVYCDDLAEARYETLEAREQNVVSTDSAIDEQEWADKSLLCLSAMWDIIEYLIEKAGVLDGREFDKAFKAFKKQMVCNLDLSRPDDRLVREARNRVELAAAKGTYDKPKVRMELVREDLDMADVPTKEALKQQVSEEFEQLVAPMLLAIAHTGQVS
jgi:hypothetical protein